MLSGADFKSVVQIFVACDKRLDEASTHIETKGAHKTTSTTDETKKQATKVILIPKMCCSIFLEHS